MCATQLEKRSDYLFPDDIMSNIKQRYKGNISLYVFLFLLLHYRMSSWKINGNCVCLCNTTRKRRDQIFPGAVLSKRQENNYRHTIATLLTVIVDEPFDSVCWLIY